MSRLYANSEIFGGQSKFSMKRTTSGREKFCPWVFSLKTGYEAGLNIALYILHFMFPLRSYLYSTNKTSEIKWDFFKVKCPNQWEMLISNN